MADEALIQDFFYLTSDIELSLVVHELYQPFNPHNCHPSSLNIILGFISTSYDIFVLLVSVHVSYILGVIFFFLQATQEIPACPRKWSPAGQSSSRGS